MSTLVADQIVGKLHEPRISRCYGNRGGRLLESTNCAGLRTFRCNR
jgi:hypothetical protein